MSVYNGSYFELAIARIVDTSIAIISIGAILPIFVLHAAHAAQATVCDSLLLAHTIHVHFTSFIS